MAETTWNYTIQDFSPLLQYSGSSNSQGSSSGLNPAWQQSCTGNTATQDGTIVEICDGSSVHTTSLMGATVSLSFYGQAIQFFGQVTSGMAYKVTIDGSTEDGSPSGQVLASVSDLSLGSHTANITAYPSGTSSTLSFESIVVTVGTGLTGANITRSDVQDSDASLTYTPTAFWFSILFGSDEIQHTLSNTTWHQINAATSGSVNIPFSGHALLVYGLSWSWFDSPYTVALDGQAPPITFFGNSALSNSSSNYMYTDGLMYFQANPTGSAHNLVIENSNGAGVVALDYVEIITISGGTPFSGSTGSPPSSSTTGSSKNHVSLGVIIGPVLGAVVLLLLLSAFVIRRRRAWSKGFENATPTIFELAPGKTLNGPASNTEPSPVSPRRPVLRMIPNLTSSTVSREYTPEETQVADISPQRGPPPPPPPPPPPETGNLDPHSHNESMGELQTVRRNVSRILEIVGDPEDRPPMVQDGSAEEIRAVRMGVTRILEILDQPPVYGE